MEYERAANSILQNDFDSMNALSFLYENAKENHLKPSKNCFLAILSIIKQ